MTTSKSMYGTGPQHPHLAHRGGGVQGEVWDLRQDVDTAFGRTETPGHGGTSLVAVEEFTNPTAKVSNKFMTSKNFGATAQVITGAGLTGTAASPPRNVIVSVTITGGVGAGTVTVTGTDVNGDAIHEHFTVPAATNTVTGTSAFSSVTQVDIPAHGSAFTGSLVVGDGDAIGLGSKVKVRNTVPNVFFEMESGVAVGGGGTAATATNQNTTATNNNTVATNQNATPTITAAKVRLQQHFGALAAAGTNYVAQFAGGAAIDSAGPFTRFVPPRTVQIARGGVGAATVYTITGTDPDGGALVETINSAGAATVQGVRAFTTITRVQSDVNPTVTTDVQTGAGFGLAVVASDIDAVSLTGVLEAPSSSHAATGTVVPGTAPNGVRTYTVDYRVLPTATQAAHTHVQDTHTHVQAAHGHTQNAHSHGGSGGGVFATPSAGAPNGTYSPVTIPNGAVDYTIVYERDLT